MADKILKPDDIAKAVILKKRLKVGYFKFFKAFFDKYGTLSGGIYAAKGAEALKLIEKCAALIDKVYLDSTGDTPDLQRLGELNASLYDLQTIVLDFIGESLKLTTHEKLLKMYLDAATEKTNIKIEDLNLDIDISDQLKKKIEEEKTKAKDPITQFLSAFGMTPKGAGEGFLASQLIAPILGPYMSAVIAIPAALKYGKAAAGGISKGVGWLNKMRDNRSKKETAITKPGTPQVPPMPSSEEEVAAQEEPKEPQKAEVIETKSQQPRDALGRWTRTPIKEVFSAQKTGANVAAGVAATEVGGASVASSLFLFFNEHAFKAKWTGNLLKACQGKDSGTKRESGGSDLTELIEALPLLGVVAASIFTGFMVNKASKTASELIETKGKAKEQQQKQSMISQKFVRKGKKASLQKYKKAKTEKERQIALDEYKGLVQAGGGKYSKKQKAEFIKESTSTSSVSEETIKSKKETPAERMQRKASLGEGKMTFPNETPAERKQRKESLGEGKMTFPNETPAERKQRKASLGDERISKADTTAQQIPPSTAVTSAANQTSVVDSVNTLTAETQKTNALLASSRGGSLDSAPSRPDLMFDVSLGLKMLLANL